MSIHPSALNIPLRSHSAPPDLSLEPPDALVRRAEETDALFKQMRARIIEARTRTFDLQAHRRDVLCSEPFLHPEQRTPAPITYTPVYAPLFPLEQEPNLNPRLTPETDDSPAPSSPEFLDNGDDADISSPATPTPIFSKPCVIQVQVENPDEIPFRILFFYPPTHIATDYLVERGRTVRCLKGVSGENVAFCD